MKNFNSFAEALLVSVVPKSDSVGPVTGDSECPCQKQDMFSQNAEELLNSINPIQPDDDVGEQGELQSDSESTEDSSGIELECTEDGLRVKFGGMEVVLPKSVVEKIKTHVEHEDSETPEQEEAEHAEGETEEEEHAEDEVAMESVKNPKAVCAASMEMGKKKGKGTKAAQAKRERKFGSCVKSVAHKK